MIRTARFFIPLAVLLTSAPTMLAGQALDVPHSIRRRLGQALWPEVVFDSAGYPVPGYLVRGFRGDPATDLAVEAVTRDSSLPGLKVYRGSASRCFDCDLSLAAVVQKGEQTATLLGPRDLELVLPWLLAPSAADSGALARATVQLLRSTCILGCGAARLDRKEQLSSFHSALCRGPTNSKNWDLPKASQHQNGSFLEYEFNVWAGAQIYRLRVSWTDDQYHVSADELADCALRA